MNIYVKAYLDKNLGDDLMLIHLIHHIDLKDKLFVHCQEDNLGFYKELLHEYPQVTLVNCPLRKIPKNFGLKFFSCILQIGGSVLMGNSYTGCWYRTLNYFLIRCLQINGVKYGILGCNVGPFKNEFTKRFVKLEISSADFLTVRDQFSYHFIKRVCGSDKQVSVFPDILVKTADNLGIVQTAIKPMKCLGISVHGPSGDVVNEALTELCIDYIRNTAGRVLLFCFHVGEQRDEEAAVWIYSKIPVQLRQSVEIVRHSIDYRNVLTRIGDCTEILAIRFHAAILAISQNIPFIAVAYNNKMSNYLKALNVKGVELEEFSKMSGKDLLHKLLYEPIIPQNQWKLDSEQHFEILRRELDG